MEPAVIHVDVEPGEHGSLTVSWALTAPSAVEIAVGTTPDATTHRHVGTADAATTATVLTERPPGLTYVSVTPVGSAHPVVAGERRVGFSGVQNFRDLGGYRSELGGRTRWGHLYRADSLHTLTPADIEQFHSLGLRVVFDLRGDRERETHPNPFEHAIQLAVVGRPPSDDTARDRRAFVENLDGERVLRDLYIGMLVHSQPLFTRLFRTLLEPEGTPAVFHCHAGKDRTGVVAALVLLAVGVDRDTVLIDYEHTRRYRTADHAQDSYENLINLGMSPEAAAGVLSTPRWAMADALDSLDEDHGGIERYLVDTLGLSPAELDTLRSLLLA